MAEYKTGVVKTATGYADFLYQNQEGNMDGDEVTAKDENGNTAASPTSPKNTFFQAGIGREKCSN